MDFKKAIIMTSFLFCSSSLMARDAQEGAVSGAGVEVTDERFDTEEVKETIVDEKVEDRIDENVDIDEGRFGGDGKEILIENEIDDRVEDKIEDRQDGEDGGFFDGSGRESSGNAGKVKRYQEGSSGSKRSRGSRGGR